MNVAAGSLLGTVIQLPLGVRIFSVTVWHATTTVGGTITATLMDNGVATAVVSTLTAGNVGGTGNTPVGLPLSIAATHTIGWNIANGAGVTTGLGATWIVMFYSLA